MNICKTFGIYVAICVLPLGGCSSDLLGPSDPKEQVMLGDQYSDGEGVPQDYAAAAKCYRLAAEQGNAEAQNKLGVCYAWGRGVPRDTAEGVKWTRLAAEQGYLHAQARLGSMYEAGSYLPKDYAEAAKWYRLAAEQGHENCCLKTGCRCITTAVASKKTLQKR